MRTSSWIVVFVVFALSGCAGIASQILAPGAQSRGERARTSTASSFVFSQYKGTWVNMNWNNDVLGTAVTGKKEPLLDAMQAKNAAMTLAFATGTCGSENWSGVSADDFITANMQSFVKAGKYYIISTGGAGGSFLCPMTSAFLAFVAAYYTPNMLGVDFDIENGQTQSQIDDLVADVQAAQQQYPTMRFSFTVATLGGDANPALGSEGQLVMNAVTKYGLSNYLIDLMTMDYGSANSSNCVVVKGKCEMGKSAVRAAMDLNAQFGVPYVNVEITPMIGGNDTKHETFTIGDAATVSTFVKQNGVNGVHFWSFDRDRNCPPGPAKGTCNSYGKGGTLGFTDAFISGLGL
jgi:chitinase